MKIDMRKVTDGISSRYYLIQTLQQIWREISNEWVF